MNWPDLQEPLVQWILLAAAGLVVLVLVLRTLQRVRERLAAGRRRAELRRVRAQIERQQEETHKLAAQIVATSSTRTIAGFVILRQVEAVFTEGQRSPGEAAEALKAMAARKGGNALINLAGQRLPDGKYVASGDAVVVRETRH
jgi:hypothetical protein